MPGASGGVWLPKTHLGARSGGLQWGDVDDDEVAQSESRALLAVGCSAHASSRANGRSPPFASITALRGSVLVAMVQPADLGQLYHPAQFRPLRRPWFWCIARQ